MPRYLVRNIVIKQGRRIGEYKQVYAKNQEEAVKKFLGGAGWEVKKIR